MPDETGLRVATVAAWAAERLDASPADRASAFYLSMLRFIGCTANGNQSADLFGDEAEFGADAQGTDFGNPREAMAAMLRYFRKTKGTFGAFAAMARAMSKLPGM